MGCPTVSSPNHVSCGENRSFFVTERCLEERDQALKASNSSGIPIFVPVCHSDGSYVDVQCHYGTGYCWCVSQDGKPVPGSSIRYTTAVVHSVSLFTSQECPRIHLDRNPRQNCPIGQPSTKKWFFSPDQFGPWPECKGKSGEIRSLLETLGSTLYPRKKLYLPKSYSKNFLCDPPY